MNVDAKPRPRLAADDTAAVLPLPTPTLAKPVSYNSQSAANCDKPGVAWGRAAQFAMAVLFIGLVVLPTASAVSDGVTTTALVAGRAFWGAVTAVILCFFIGEPKKLVTIKSAQLKDLTLRALVFGIATIALYTWALSLADATPVILTVVGVAGLVGTLFDGRGKLFLLFIPIAVLIALAAALASYHGIGRFGLFAFALSATSGALYGLQPKLIRTGAVSGVEAVAQYLFIAAALALLPMLTDPVVAVQMVFRMDVAAAGVIASGIPYVLMQLAMAPDRHGRRLPETWASLLFGIEPLTVMLIAVVIMGQPFSLVATIFALGFILLIALAGPLLNHIHHTPKA